MSEPSTDKSWQQFAPACFSLLPSISIVAQVFRGVRWYIVKDEASSNFSRFNQAAYEFIRRLDENTSTAEIHQQLQLAARQQGQQAKALSQTEIVTLLQQLIKLQLIRSTQPQDAALLADKQKKALAAKRKQRFSNPLALKIPLADPNQLLSRIAPAFRFVFTKTTAAIWLLVVLAALCLCAVNSHRLAAALNPDILQPDNLVAMTLLYVLLKALHEFAHALAVKVWGGEVHEMGISFLVFAPVPYVDASAAWAFREKSKRIWVSAMGILVEVFVAALAIFTWFLVEPGLLKTSCLNLAIIASVSTILFNANPLLKFDGYYILQDAIESPNLYARARLHCLSLLQRFLLGARDVRSPAYDRGEALCFLAYAPAAFIYRLFILLTITLYLINNFLLVGVALATWSVYSQILLPSLKGLRYVARDPALSGCRSRALFSSACLLLLLLGTATFVQLPHSTHVKGVVWVDEQAELYSAQNGFLAEIMVSSGQNVSPGTVLMKLVSPELDNKISQLNAQKKYATIESNDEYVKNKGKSNLKNHQVDRLIYELETALNDQQELIIKSKSHGVFISPDIEGKKGKYFKQGEFIGYVFSPENLVIKTVVSQTQIGDIRSGTEDIEIKLAESTANNLRATVIQETPASSKQLPSKALGAAGGGDIAVQNTSQQQNNAAEDLFSLKLAIDDEITSSRVGGIAYVKLVHPNKTLASRVSKKVKMLYLNNMKI